MLFPPGSGHFATEVEVERAGRFAPWLVKLVRRVLMPIVWVLFRPSLSGTANLPTDRAYLLVANHSAGLALAEIGAFYSHYLRDVGPEHPLAGFALPLDFRVPVFRELVLAAGAIPSTYDAAQKTLAAGVPILVFPGGDYESLRPVWQAHRVDFGGRLGFLRIAREAGVPVVPMGIRGSHFTAPILWRAGWLATLLVQPRLIGQKRWGLSLLGVIGAVLITALVPASLAVRLALAWLWLGSPLAFIPWVPATIRMRIGVAFEAAELFAGQGGDDALRAALQQVERTVQSLVRR